MLKLKNIERADLVESHKFHIEIYCRRYACARLSTECLVLTKLPAEHTCITGNIFHTIFSIRKIELDFGHGLKRRELQVLEFFRHYRIKFYGTEACPKYMYLSIIGLYVRVHL